MKSNVILTLESFWSYVLKCYLLTFSSKDRWENEGYYGMLPAAVGEELGATAPEERGFRSSAWFTLHLHLASTSSRDQLSHWVQPKIWSLDWEPGPMKRKEQKRGEGEVRKWEVRERNHKVWEKGGQVFLGKCNHKYNYNQGCGVIGWVK